jgi:hypothetical protein
MAFYVYVYIYIYIYIHTHAQGLISIGKCKEIEGDVFNKCRNFQNIKDLPTCKPGARLIESELTEPNVI